MFVLFRVDVLSRFCSTYLLQNDVLQDFKAHAHRGKALTIGLYHVLYTLRVQKP
jgi:hypothetical protein